MEESLENPILLGSKIILISKACNRMGTEGARLCDGAVHQNLSNLSGKKTELMVMQCIGLFALCGLWSCTPGCFPYTWKHLFLCRFFMLIGGRVFLCLMVYCR